MPTNRSSRSNLLHHLKLFFRLSVGTFLIGQHLLHIAISQPTVDENSNSNLISSFDCSVADFGLSDVPSYSELMYAFVTCSVDKITQEQNLKSELRDQISELERLVDELKKNSEPLIGPPGSPGFAGVAGFTGKTGVIGSMGFTGNTGPAGLQGSSGAIGPIGSSGSTGPYGLSGPVGPNGPDGVPGLAGAPGATGPQGALGAIGATGQQGPPGPIGDPGEPGDTGSPGPITLPPIQ